MEKLNGSEKERDPSLDTFDTLQEFEAALKRKLSIEIISRSTLNSSVEALGANDGHYYLVATGKKIMFIQSAKTWSEVLEVAKSLSDIK